MPFPETERVIYEKSALESVKCKIRYPTILSIEATPPAAFQDAIRENFPLFETQPIPVNLPPDIAKAIKQAVGAASVTANAGSMYVFSSEDKLLSVALTKNSVELTSRKYSRWEEFLACMTHITRAFHDVYRPAFITHSCVTYRNAIHRQSLGLDNEPWPSLLQPWICGPFGNDTANVEKQQSKFTIQLPDDNGKLEATTSLGTHIPTQQRMFGIESHTFHDARKAIADVEPRLTILNRQSGLFFRWCITERLHRAMRPNPA